VFRALLLGLFSVLLALPAMAAEPPGVDLRRWTWRGAVAVAPMSRGGDAELTLDAELQRAADRLLDAAAPSSGAIVAVDARTGRVLVWSERLAARQRPGSMLLDARVPAASVFKLVTTATLLETARVDPTEIVCYAGGRYAIERRHLERPRPGEVARCAPFADALGHSRNAVFAQLTTRHLARADLVEMAARLGFGSWLPFDVPILTGRVDFPFSDLLVARTAAGFRGNSLSVLGGAHLAATIASGGRAMRLRIVSKAGSFVAPAERELQAGVLSPATARQLTRMMEVTVHSGTSREAFTADSGMSYLGAIRVAGKTGTLHPADPSQTTSWFVGFAPSRAPELIVTVLLQNGRVWRRKANQVARDLLRAYFHAQGRPLVSDPFEDHRTLVAR
jgi:cell division protein FtsI/penicillin-binding protein 2